MRTSVLKNASFVDVLMVTYNHEKYIEQAICSVLSQKCEFDFRLIIGDDASNDRTSEICKKYSEKYPGMIFLLRSKSNLGLIKNYKQVFDLIQAKYVAILEGDDFWTDNNKLSKQINILEKDASVGLVYTGFNVLYENGTIKRAYSVREKSWNNYIYTEMLTGKLRIPASITSCFRSEIMQKYFDFDYFINNDFQTLDAPLWYEIAYHSRICFIPDITACYRVLSTSISNNNNLERQEAFRDTSIRTIKYYYNKYPVDKYSEDECLTNRYYLLTQVYLKHKAFGKAKLTSEKMKLNKPKYFFIWFFAHYKLLMPLFNFYFSGISVCSSAKQLIYKAQLRLCKTYNRSYDKT